MSVLEPPSSATGRLDVNHLQKTYASRTGGVEAIRDLDFSVGAGEFVCIVGPSGAGKTTLLRCTAGLLHPSGGTVAVDGATVAGPPPSMAVVLQEYGRSLMPWLTVEANVELPLKSQRLAKAERRERVRRALESVGLSDFASSHPWQLSGGMQQRVAIARALAYRPSVLLMDEPFAAVDAQTRANLEDLVRHIWTEYGITVVFVTHDIDESIYLAERVLVLSKAPTVVVRDVRVDLPAERDQLTTRALPRFAELRSEVYRLIQDARPGSEIV